MSDVEIPSPAIRSGFSQIRMEYSREAMISADETPGIRLIASLMFEST